ncbi:MAG: GNAT family N-acetyltransferase [Clostridia bacterium]|nr:GNAT family N-acetyltransferase [Clostridia bacterium]NCC76587.1 GNAT family N-acetyltransferase [Clostridia bacterium]
MHADIIFRQAVPADSTELLKLIQWAMQVYAAKSGITTPLDAFSETVFDLEQQIARDHVIVAEHKHALIGTVRLVRRSPDQAYFTRFAVHPHLQQTGVGRLLFQAAEAWLLQNGFSIVELHTALTNETLVNFYQSRGFVLVETDSSRGYPRGLFRKIL